MAASLLAQRRALRLERGAVARPLGVDRLFLVSEPAALCGRARGLQLAQHLSADHGARLRVRRRRVGERLDLGVEVDSAQDFPAFVALDRIRDVEIDAFDWICRTSPTGTGTRTAAERRACCGLRRQ